MPATSTLPAANVRNPSPWTWTRCVRTAALTVVTNAPRVRNMPRPRARLQRASRTRESGSTGDLPTPVPGPAGVRTATAGPAAPLPVSDDSGAGDEPPQQRPRTRPSRSGTANIPHWIGRGNRHGSIRRPRLSRTRLSRTRRWIGPGPTLARASSSGAIRRWISRVTHRRTTRPDTRRPPRRHSPRSDGPADAPGSRCRAAPQQCCAPAQRVGHY